MKKFLNRNSHIIHMLLFLIWFSVLLIGFISSDTKELHFTIPLMGLISLILQLFLIVLEENLS